MNGILTEKINRDITNIIGSYLLPTKQQIDTYDLKFQINMIKMRLDEKIIFLHKFGFAKIHCENFNNCKIIRLKLTKEWTVRLKSYKNE